MGDITSFDLALIRSSSYYTGATFVRDSTLFGLTQRVIATQTPAYANDPLPTQSPTPIRPWFDLDFKLYIVLLTIQFEVS